jgi:hypothetical protein
MLVHPLPVLLFFISSITLTSAQHYYRRSLAEDLYGRTLSARPAAYANVGSAEQQQAAPSEQDRYNFLQSADNRKNRLQVYSDAATQPQHFRQKPPPSTDHAAVVPPDPADPRHQMKQAEPQQSQQHDAQPPQSPKPLRQISFTRGRPSALSQKSLVALRSLSEGSERRSPNAITRRFSTKAWSAKGVTHGKIPESGIDPGMTLTPADVEMKAKLDAMSARRARQAAEAAARGGW